LSVITLLVIDLIACQYICCKCSWLACWKTGVAQFYRESTLLPPAVWKISPMVMIKTSIQSKYHNDDSLALIIVKTLANMQPLSEQNSSKNPWKNRGASSSRNSCGSWLLLTMFSWEVFSALLQHAAQILVGPIHAELCQGRLSQHSSSEENANRQDYKSIVFAQHYTYKWHLSS